jgi:hypothetical protein
MSNRVENLANVVVLKAEAVYLNMLCSRIPDLLSESHPMGVALTEELNDELKRLNKQGAYDEEEVIVSLLEKRKK